MAVRVVILGGGFGGLNVARRLERLGRRGELDVTLVNRENYMLFTPMLPEVASATVEPRHITPALRSILSRTTFELGEITAVDIAAKTVVVQRRGGEGDATLPFDQLVVALGAENSTHGVPGAQEHTYPLKTLSDAVALRDVTISALENAETIADPQERRALTTFVIVGGGFTGVETAGELLAFLRSATRFYRHLTAQDIHVVLVAGNDRLLEQLPQAFGDRAHAMLTARGIEIVLDDEVAAVDAGGLTLASGTRYESRCVMWSAGVRPSPLAATFDLAHSKHHALDVAPDLAVRDAIGIWSLGDCAHVPKPGGGAYPQTAQHAVNEADRLARNLIATIRGKKTKPYVYRTRGMLASLGAREGLAQFAGRATITGLPAWLLWRGYYLTQLPGMSRKTRVALDWSLNVPFPHDIASVR